jgi:hypothetical protein
MAVTINSQVNFLNEQTQSFGAEIAVHTQKWERRAVNLSEVEETHRGVSEIFQKIMKGISECKLKLHAQYSNSYDDRIFDTIGKVTGLETTIEEKLNQFNDMILTNYPTAKIGYGRPCIGESTRPKEIKTGNKAVLNMLDNCSKVREVRGDGNCFFSALVTALLEYPIGRETLIKYTLEDSCTTDPRLNELANNIAMDLLALQDNPSESNVNAFLRDNHKVLPLINYFRKLAAEEILKNKELQMVLRVEIENEYPKLNIHSKPLSDLIKEFVLKMGVDCSHTMIQAVCRKLEFPVRIIDPNRGTQQGLNILGKDFEYATFCRLDNHYFVLYPKTQAVAAPVPVVAPITIPQQVSRPAVAPIAVPQQVSRPVEVVTVKYNTGFGNRLEIRGTGPGMTWDQGKLDKVDGDSDTWVFKTKEKFNHFDYKIVFIDGAGNIKWDLPDGVNRKMISGEQLIVYPTFPD